MTPTPFKASDLAACLICKKGVMHDHQITFLRVRIEQFVINPDAVRRAVGEEMMMGALASVLGRNEDIAGGLGEHSGLVCLGCSSRPGAAPWELLEAASNG